MPGGQQQPVFDPFLGTAPETAVMVSFSTALLEFCSFYGYFPRVKYFFDRHFCFNLIAFCSYLYYFLPSPKDLHLLFFFWILDVKR